MARWLPSHQEERGTFPAKDQQLLYFSRFQVHLKFKGEWVGGRANSSSEKKVKLDGIGTQHL